MNLSRRQTLKLISGAALVVGTAPLISACRGLERDDLARGDSGEVSGSGLNPELREILYHASLAPSGHNTQPWTVRIPEPGRLVIGTAMERRLPGVDPLNRELLLSIGAFLENLVVTARHHGHDLEYRVIASSPADQELLEVKLLQANPVDFALEKIRLRRTVRGHHQAQELKTEDLRALSEPLRERLVFFPRGSVAGKYLQEGTVEANRLQAYRDAAQEELSRWIRWSDNDARKFRNGLTPEAMEITGFAGWYVRHFMNRRSVLKKSFRDTSVDVVRKQLQSYGGWLVVTSADSSMRTLVETGRSFERMLLGIRERMIAIHPMTQMLEEAPFREGVAKELGVSSPVQFILRASYLKRYPDPVSLRMPVSWFVRT